MKRKFITAALTAGFLLMPSGTLMAEEQVNVTLPTFPVALNGVIFDQSQLEYPLLVYKNITYVAMTYHDARLLGLETQWTQENGFSIDKMDVIPEQLEAQQQYVPYISDNINASTGTAVRPTFAITVNGKAIDNNKEEYPLLVFRDVTYFPLTWRFAVDEFGWDYTFDIENGLDIAPVPTPIQPEASETVQAETVITNGTAVYVTGDVVNLRTGAGTSYERAGQVLEGDKLTVCGNANDSDGKKWYQVQMEDGAKFWIASWLVSVEADNTELEVSTGVRMDAVLKQPVQDGRKTVFAIKNGEGNIHCVVGV